MWSACLHASKALAGSTTLIDRLLLVLWEICVYYILFAKWMFLSLFTIQNDTLSALHTSCCNPPALITTQLLFLSLFLTLWCFCMDCSSSLNPHSVTVAVSTLVSSLLCFALWCEDRCRSASAPALGTVLSPSLSDSVSAWHIKARQTLWKRQNYRWYERNRPGVFSRLVTDHGRGLAEMRSSLNNSNK